MADFGHPTSNIPTTDSIRRFTAARDVDGAHLGQLEDLLHLFLRDVVENLAEAWIDVRRFRWWVEAAALRVEIFKEKNGLGDF